MSQIHLLKTTKKHSLKLLQLILQVLVGNANPFVDDLYVV